MENKHTLAPWRILQNSQGMYCVEVARDRPDTIAAVGYSQEDKVNAQLIAAAPELLEALIALKGLVQGNSNDHITRACNDATRAIAKAEGK